MSGRDMFRGMAGMDNDGSLRNMVQLLKHIFDEAVLAGFTQDEAMKLTSMTMQAFLGQALGTKNKDAA